eukprot:TRINITY_DN2108_c0_g1_i1.p1 TRINITY_DN2108_c0_g1~~TRINITY_DN2108_c0_g1_i1.p1  ORF type:complete len:184 (-),score=19.61 TRINITY_DN2108_c0_g1_i1:94-645(-)
MSMQDFENLLNWFFSDNCVDHAIVWGSLGSAFGLVFANMGAAYGIAKSFGGYLVLGNTKGIDQAMLIKGLVPAIMASVRGVYGLIISILISVGFGLPASYSLQKGFAQFFAGMCVGLTGLGSGYCMGIVGDVGMASVARKPQLYVGVLLMLVFAEALGLYGLIISLILVGKVQNFDGVCGTSS